MNKILFVSIISIFISQMGFAQDSLIKYEKIVILDSSYTKTELFIKARQWISDNFRDAKAILTIEDKESGELSGNARISIVPLKGMQNLGIQYVRFKCSIILKDGKYKCSFYNFEHESLTALSSLGMLTSSSKYPYAPYKGLGAKMFNNTLNNAWIDVKEQVEKEIENSYTSLERAIREKEKNEGW